MHHHTKPLFLRAILSILGIIAASLTALVGVAAPANAADGNIRPPFNYGETWNICQGYGGSVTHTGTSLYGIDLTGAGCDSSAAGRQVIAPISGTLAYAYQASYGNLCINITGTSRSYTLTHINSTVTGSVTAGQEVGTVAAAGQRNNNGMAHIHFQIWDSPNCYNNNSVPFDSAHGTRICGAPNMTPGTTGGQGTWSGTSFTGATCGSISSTSYRVAFQGNTGDLYTYNSASGAAHLPLGMMAGTSPSITTLSTGGYQIAFQGNTGDLFTYNPSGAAHVPLGMKMGTSPSIAALPGGSYEIAFQGNTGDLYTYDPVNGATHLPLGMMAGTSPSIAALSNGGYVIAFQANNGDLYTYSSPTNVTTHLPLGMKMGTSPSVTALPGGSHQIAFQGNTGDLYTYNSASGAAHLPLGMMAGTSPSITTLSTGGYQIAFQGNTGDLFTYNPSGAAHVPLGMKMGTSPSIAALPGGSYEIAFQGNTGDLYTYDPVNGATHLPLGMMAGTSPSGK